MAGPLPVWAPTTMVRAPARLHHGVKAYLRTGDEDIFPDPNAKAMAKGRWSDPKAFESAFAGT